MPDTQQAPAQSRAAPEAQAGLARAYRVRTQSRPATRNCPNRSRPPGGSPSARPPPPPPGDDRAGDPASALYLMAIFAGFVAPYDYADESRELLWSPPTGIHFSDAKGFSWRPFVHPFKMDFDENFNIVRDGGHVAAELRPLLYRRSMPYKLLGVIPCRTHLFGVDPAPDGTRARTITPALPARRRRLRAATSSAGSATAPASR